MKDYNFLQQKYVVNTYPNRGITLVKGKGVYLYDDKGKKYLDALSNIGVNIFGYNHPQITNALIKQLETLTTLHGTFTSDVRSEAAQKLIKMSAGKLSQVYFSNSGSEAIEAAIKFALWGTKKRRIIAMRDSYHGKTLGALSLTHSDKYHGSIKDVLLDVVYADFGDIASLKKLINDKTAFVILEPIQGESGIIVPSDGYLKAVEMLCQKNNVLLIIDEIQTGCGRTGKFLALQRENIQPDILCLGKGLAGGIPVGATLISSEIHNHIKDSRHTSTFGGNPLACAGIIATLDLLNPLRDRSLNLIGRFNKINNKHIKSVRGIGFMIGVQVDLPQTQVLKSLQNQGIIAGPAGSDVIRFLPPLIITKKEVDMILAAFERALT